MGHGKVPSPRKLPLFNGKVIDLSNAHPSWFRKKITPTRYHPMLPVITTRSPGLILKILHGNESQRFKIGNHGLLVVWVSANLKTPGQLLGGGGRK
jgi:hypothetical protein